MSFTVQWHVEQHSHWPKAGSLHCSDHLSVSRVLITLKAAAFRLESFLHLACKNMHFSFIFNPNLQLQNSINLVIRHYSGFKTPQRYTYTFHLSPTSRDQDLGLTKTDKVALFQLWADIYHIHPDMWHWEGQAEPAWRLRPFITCASKTSVTSPHIRMGRKSVEPQTSSDFEMSCNVKHFETHDGAYLSTSSVVTTCLWGVGRSHPSKCLGGFVSSGTFFHLA